MLRPANSHDAVCDRALALAARGLPVLPCTHKKVPITPHGFKDAALDPDVIKAWNWQYCLIAVPTGQRSGIMVLDIDTDDGGDAFYNEHADKLITRTHVTRSGGKHLLFAYRDGLGIKNSAKLIAPGVDIRTEGGMAIWWPLHGCEIIHNMPLSELPPWPDWLTKLVVAAKPKSTRNIALRVLPNGRQRDELANPAYVRKLISAVRGSADGDRNNTLFRIGCRIAELKFVSSTEQRQALSDLYYAALSVGLGHAEIERTINSALKQ